LLSGRDAAGDAKAEDGIVASDRVGDVPTPSPLNRNHAEGPDILINAEQVGRVKFPFLFIAITKAA
jgi:hypothetical protein